MIIIPAIDIIKGKVVRLHQGDFNKEKVYSDDPLNVALGWQEKGAKLLHLVDLDGAKHGVIKNKDVMARILKGVRVPCEVGGGLREEADIEYYLDQGASRVVIGTKAFEDIGYLRKMTKKFKDKIVVSIDSSGGKVVKRGWQEKTGLLAVDVAGKMQEAGVRTIVVTDIATDGTLEGPNVESLRGILDSVDISVIASGGISCLDDIKRLKEMNKKNLEGVIIGRALYEGKIDLTKAILTSQNCNAL
ncbi:MAG: 1-(5-phosphoribosyl)-5-[(5-phosphoribosylamino)methylideneamino]imidazole-4-carboxamide isomerase [Candidatus Omnitrophica bacterium]|nr:1-(5-phosphoribosyl)-5-[(5-phosphoribosylamino)methylideneamino]imidazole-4-carboxamide isomerase [Candidatus Omnitrophota bacterium]